MHYSAPSLLSDELIQQLWNACFLAVKLTIRYSGNNELKWQLFVDKQVTET